MDELVKKFKLGLRRLGDAQCTLRGEDRYTIMGYTIETLWTTGGSLSTSVWRKTARVS